MNWSGVDVAIQDYVRMLLVEEVPPGGDAGIVAGQGGGQTGPQGLMPVGQDARLRRGVEVVAEPLGFCAAAPQPPT